MFLSVLIFEEWVLLLQLISPGIHTSQPKMEDVQLQVLLVAFVSPRVVRALEIVL